MTRKGWCEFPASAKRHAYRHEDLLIVYADAESKIHGMFWDNEDHIIIYSDVHFEPGETGVRFVSDPDVPGPRQQLEYRFEKPDHLSAVFSLFLPGASGFTPYLRWMSRRSK
jgi:hypothetical protein